MVKIPKIQRNVVFNNVKPKSGGSKSNPRLFQSGNLFSKHLMLLGTIGITLLSACEWDYPKYIYPDIMPEINEKDLLQEQLDNYLKALGVILTPDLSLADFKTFYFESSEGDKYFFKYESLNKQTIHLKNIKYDKDLKREDSELYISKLDEGLLVNYLQGYNAIKFLFKLEGSELKMLKYKDNNWLEDSILKQTNNSEFVRIKNDGMTVLYNNIKNNVEFPVEIYFDDIEENEDDVIFSD